MPKPRIKKLDLSQLKRFENIMAAHDHDLLISLKGEVKWIKRLVLALYPLILAEMGIKLFTGG